jgi:hypothetical protein
MRRGGGEPNPSSKIESKQGKIKSIMIISLKVRIGKGIVPNKTCQVQI